jgi:iron complex outermembrane receptor protein
MKMNELKIVSCAGLGTVLLWFLSPDARADSTATNSADVAGAALEEIIVTARRRPEDAQTVPISLSVVDATTLERTATYNISQLTQLVPSLNYTSPNPRNTSFTIRGLGSSVVAIAQSNDGLEPGVGFYVDQVYHGRPASAAFDFVDLDQVEVLRGPQGTLFGKNTTAGAINVTSRAPTFTREAETELSGGDYGFYQAKAFLSGPLLTDAVAGRISVATTGRDGVLRNVTTGGYDNNVGTLAARGQLLFTPSDRLQVRVIADFSRFDATCCTQVFYDIGTTLKPQGRQFPALAGGFGYLPPSANPYDRLTDIDAPVKVATNEGGLSAIGDWNLGSATLTSVSAWRWWNWDAANDRDYTSLSIQTLQHIPSRQDQYSQEFRIASNGHRAIDYVAGLYWFAQTITGEPITQYGPVATYWLLGPTPKYPYNLLDGYGTDGHTRFHSDSYAAFGEAIWHATSALSLTAGLRYTEENKQGRYDSSVYGGLATTDPALISAQLSILRPQSYAATVSDGSPTGRISLSYDWNDEVLTYVNYAKGSKSGGINMSGLPLNASNLPALSTAVVKPEKNTTTEIGLKSKLFGHRLLLNVDVYDTIVRDFQTNVVDTGPGALRGYLANIDKVEVKGIELDASFRLSSHLTGHASGAWTDGKYVSYKNGPCPLELIGSTTTVCDLSGLPITATPRSVMSIGAEYAQPARLGRLHGETFIRADATSRGRMYGDSSDSKYAVIDGYTLVNASLGFRASRHWEASVWAKNLTNRNYMQNLTIQAGNSGLVVGTPSDPRIVGVSLRARF